MKQAVLAALFAACCFLPGCSSDNAKAARLRNPAPCPNVIVLNDASRMIEFDGEEAAQNVAWSAEIVSASLDCRYYGDVPIEASVDLAMAFGRGPAAKEAAEKDFAYFVAVTRTDREVIAKTSFLVPVKFKKNSRVHLFKDTVDEIVIPRKDDSVAGGNFEVVIGLVLTPEQLIFNRSNKSLKFPEL